MAFIWDPVKAVENIRVHKIYFDDAEHIFDDPFRIRRRDDDSSITEERYQIIGEAGSVLFVVYTEEGPEDTRLISARLATAKERRIYHGRDGTTYPYGWERLDP
ncbi:hypothetical protein AGMMS50293_00740 [Spirochaetia bacterium]|nr:hypothetical protein AGMMS50293_00740 [Spirochaetia bacterium]